MEQNQSPKQKVISFIEGLDADIALTDIESKLLLFIKINKPVTTDSDKQVWTSKIGRTVFVISILLAIYSIVEITDRFNLYHHDTVRYFDVIAYCAWTIIPPSWFLFEYVWLFPAKSKLDSNELGDLKYTHELASKIWAGLVVLITAVLYIKYGGNLLFGKPH
jgi:hypothetical protein